MNLEERIATRLGEALRAFCDLDDEMARDCGDALAESGVVQRLIAQELREVASDVDDGEFSSRESAATRSVILARAAIFAPPDQPEL